MTALISGTALTRSYIQGSVRVDALRAVDFEIYEGEVTALVGPSGSGKSTMLNIIGCLDKPTGGVLRYEGKDVLQESRAAAAKFRLRNIGFVFQAFNLLPVLTAYENAEYTLLLQGVAKSKRREMVMPLFDRVGLSGMAHRKPHELSGGQQQRVAVVRAIVSRPRVVLADEPTASLDSKTTIELLDLMLELNKEHGITFVVASHDPEVRERARRVIEMRDGKIERDSKQPSN